MIELKNLTKIYGSKSKSTTALSGLNLTVDKGEVFGVIGHSGAGKSTLIRCINLLERPTGGEVWVGGRNLTALGKRELQRERRRIGMIFQHFNLLSSATVYDNIAFPLRLAGTDKAKVKSKVEELLNLVGLEAHSGKYPAQLSGGQKQRVGIARALASDPDVLLCDEATSALDPQTTDSILKLLLDINRKLGLTILLITHEMHVIQSICDRVAVIHEGGIVEQGPVAEVFLKPKHAVTKDFISRDVAGASGSSVEEGLPKARVSSFSGSPDQPESLVAKLPHADGADGAVYRITCLGENTYGTALSEVVLSTGVHFAILQGTVSTIKEVPYSQLTVSFTGTREAVELAVSKLREREFDVEVLS
ncbi:methionine ABC transporter ATP-binding protein [Paenibacillus physcomitrellae]|uniref:Methionine import ATP-binding protein MetN 3 n=1 Tax=Paenibacillus physcomitrellae TaxID=1619311 RepID=A0ABQ1G0V7_9BACL|nr:methionine ABC transporter ATP-binding protein [Paenibacillus physcomitrellae]GGA35269.1 methionine import ATP-binding protein MetN 3 [Paenibacillus physcomitrellae]